MATRKSKPRARSSRNSVDPVPYSQLTRAPGALETAQEALEEERRRLMTAEAVLRCVEIALDENIGTTADGPDYQSVIAAARELIAYTINQLDSLRMKPMLERLTAHDALVRKRPSPR